MKGQEVVCNLSGGMCVMICDKQIVSTTSAMIRAVKIFVLLLLIFLLMPGCDEDDGKVMDYKNVILVWHGKDCGFFIKIDNEHYKPINEDKIREEFQVINDTIVAMKYIDLKKNITFQCGVVGLPVEIKGIEVIDIK